MGLKFVWEDLWVIECWFIGLKFYYFWVCGGYGGSKLISGGRSSVADDSWDAGGSFAGCYGVLKL